MSVTSELLSALIVGGLYVALFAVMEIWSRHTRVSHEITRKGVHIGGGLIALTLPFLFESHWSVLILGAVLTAALLIARRRSLLPSVQAVERVTYGEVLYPAAIYLTFLLSSIAVRPHFYTIAILTLALADGTAGIVGSRFGRHTYRVAGGTKSYEGSMTFFIVCAIVTVATLSVAGIDPARAAVVAVVVALVTTIMEAVTTRGFDNVTVPLGCWGMLALTTACL